MPLWSKLKPTGSDPKAPSPEELIALARRYVVQETIGPLKRVARVLGIGVAGAFVFALGTIIVLLGVLRVLQTETGNTFGGDWNFAPYLLTALAGVLIVVATGARFASSLRTDDRDPTSAPTP